jgi:hypothetical protein
LADPQRSRHIKHGRQGWFNSVLGEARLDQVAACHGIDKIKF